jgi:hypothetical protein
MAIIHVLEVHDFSKLEDSDDDDGWPDTNSSDSGSDGLPAWVSVPYTPGLVGSSFVVHLMKMVTPFHRCRDWLAKVLGRPHRC